MTWRVEVTESAARQIRKLGPSGAARVRDYLRDRPAQPLVLFLKLLQTAELIAAHPGVPAAGSGDDHHAKLAVRLRYATPATQLGRETRNALTFEADQSTGAGQYRRLPALGE